MPTVESAQIEYSTCCKRARGSLSHPSAVFHCVCGQDGCGAPAPKWFLSSDRWSSDSMWEVSRCPFCGTNLEVE